MFLNRFQIILIMFLCKLPPHVHLSIDVLVLFLFILEMLTISHFQVLSCFFLQPFKCKNILKFYAVNSPISQLIPLLFGLESSSQGGKQLFLFLSPFFFLYSLIFSI